MLPVDSPKWSELECDLGSAQPVADGLRQAYEIVENANDDPVEIQRAVDLASMQIDRLFHQQSTYSGSAAAIPHLLEFAKIAPLKDQTYLLVMISAMDFEGAYDHAPSELDQAYSQAIHECEVMAAHIASRPGLSSEEFENVIEAVAKIQRSCVFTLRDQGAGEFECPGCEAELDAEWRRGGVLKVCPVSDSGNEEKVATVIPTADLAAEIERPEHSALAYFYRLAVAGGNEEYLGWIGPLLGTFTCPECKTDQKIAYGRYDNL